MPRVQRRDASALDGSSKTPEGYIDTYGNLTRTGVFEYPRADGSIQRELRLPEHVFADGSVASAHGQPLVVRHPRQNLDAKSFKKHVAGFVLDPKKSDDGVHLRARIRVMDADAVQAVESGLKELSNGYTTELVPIPGGVFRRDDFNGGVEVRADMLQTEILINHTALVDRGRAGPSARLDSAGNQPQGEEETMMTQEEQKALDEARALAAAEKARADEAAGKIAAYEAEQKRLDAEKQSKAKQALAARVAPHAKKAVEEIAKLDEDEIMKLGLEALGVKLDGALAANPATMRGALEVALMNAGTRTDTATKMAGAVIAVRGLSDPAKIEEIDVQASENAFRKARVDAASFWRQANKA